ncbi:unnamed protein product [Prunus armeniaca]
MFGPKKWAWVPRLPSNPEPPLLGPSMGPMTIYYHPYHNPLKQAPGAGKVFEIEHVLEGCLKTWQVLEGYLKQDSSKLSERVRSSGKHLPSAAGKRAQVDFNPFSPSPFEEALLPLLEGTFLCGFSSMILNFAPFLVYSKSPVGILASNVSTYNVGASKEGLALIFWDSLFFDLLELLEGCQFSCEQNCWYGFLSFPLLTLILL